VTLELFNDSNQRVGTGTVALNAQPQRGYSTLVQVTVSGLVRKARLHFNTSAFSYSTEAIPVG